MYRLEGELHQTDLECRECTCMCHQIIRVLDDWKDDTKQQAATLIVGMAKRKKANLNRPENMTLVSLFDVYHLYSSSRQ